MTCVQNKYVILAIENWYCFNVFSKSKALHGIVFQEQSFIITFCKPSKLFSLYRKCIMALTYLIIILHFFAPPLKFNLCPPKWKCLVTPLPHTYMYTCTCMLNLALPYKSCVHVQMGWNLVLIHSDLCTWCTVNHSAANNNIGGKKNPMPLWVQTYSDLVTFENWSFRFYRHVLWFPTKWEIRGIVSCLNSYLISLGGSRNLGLGSGSKQKLSSETYPVSI